MKDVMAKLLFHECTSCLISPSYCAYRARSFRAHVTSSRIHLKEIVLFWVKLARKSVFTSDILYMSILNNLESRVDSVSRTNTLKTHGMYKRSLLKLSLQPLAKRLQFTNQLFGPLRPDR